MTTPPDPPVHPPDVTGGRMGGAHLDGGVHGNASAHLAGRDQFLIEHLNLNVVEGQSGVDRLAGFLRGRAGRLSSVRKHTDRPVPAEVADRIERRRSLAAHLMALLVALNETPHWHDDQFTPLDVEVETQGPLLRSLPRRRWWQGESHVSAAFDRMPLANAFAPLTETGREPQIVLLEGAPGSGKSVALRHLAIQLCRQAWSDPHSIRMLPIYVNLRQLQTEAETVDWRAIQQLVMTSLGADDPEIGQLLNEELHRLDHRRRQWLFLFDSFDEIPGLLSATELDSVIKRFEGAIRDFLTRMACSGVIASRDYRRPRHSAWTILNIAPLTEERKHELAGRLGLVASDVDLLAGGLAEADYSLQELSGNPLFLALLCQHVKREHRFPSSSHEVFEAWTADRFDREHNRLLDRYGLTATRVRELAESLAFCMLREGFGTEGPRGRIAAAMARRGLADEETAYSAMAALGFTRLAAPDLVQTGGRSSVVGDAPTSFRWMHRRFQEYLATCFVLDEPGRVPSLKLLTDGRWRETGVALCQLQSDQQLAPLLRTAGRLLAQALAQIPRLAAHEDIDAGPGEPLELSRDPAPFMWPPYVLHVLALLDVGLANHTGDAIEPIRRQASQLLLTATRDGLLPDRRAALGVVGLALPNVRVRLLRVGFTDGSALLRDTAYRQAGRLSHVPADVAEQIRLVLLRMWARGEFRPQRRRTVKAQLRRLSEPGPFLGVERLLWWLPHIDAAVHVGLAVFFLIGVIPPYSGWPIFLAGSHLYVHTRRVGYGWLDKNTVDPLSTLSASLIAVGILCRFWLVLTLLLPPPLLPAVGKLSSLMFAVGLVWAPAAVGAVRPGDVTRWRGWFIPQLVTPWRLLARYYRRIVRFFLFLALICALLFLPIYYPHLPGGAKLVLAWIGKILIFFLPILGLAVMMWVLSMIRMWVAIISRIREERAGRRWLRQWFASHAESATVRDLLGWLDQVRSIDQLRRLLHAVRVERLLDRDPDVGLLVHLTAAVEQAGHRWRLRSPGPLRAFLVEPFLLLWEDWTVLWQDVVKPGVNYLQRKATEWRARKASAGTTGGVPLASNEAAGQAGDDSKARASTTREDLERWLQRVTATGGRGRRLLDYDKYCQDELMLVVEQATPWPSD